MRTADGLMPRVLVITTSMLTKWESYSQALLAWNVPEWRRMIVDGRSHWSPTGFVGHAVAEDVDFVIHVDEDCFVYDRAALLEVVERMNCEPKLVAAGVPDGGYYYRARNPAALNLFFVAFRADALREAWKRRSRWAEVPFRDEFRADVLTQRPELDLSLVGWDKPEPYYPLFWSLLESGGRFLYLKQDLLRARWSTRIYAPSGGLIGEHLWYLRQWFQQTAMTGHDCPNVARYRMLRDELLERYGSNLRFRSHLIKAAIGRCVRRLGVPGARYRSMSIA